MLFTDLMNAPDYDLAALVPPGIYAVDARRLLEQARGEIDAVLSIRPGEGGAALADHRKALDRQLRRVAAGAGVEGGALFRLLRVALMGRLASPGLFDMIALLGPSETTRRIDVALRSLTDTSR